MTISAILFYSTIYNLYIFFNGEKKNNCNINFRINCILNPILTWITFRLDKWLQIYSIIIAFTTITLNANTDYAWTKFGHPHTRLHIGLTEEVPRRISHNLESAWSKKKTKQQKKKNQASPHWYTSQFQHNNTAKPARLIQNKYTQSKLQMMMFVMTFVSSNYQYVI